MDKSLYSKIPDYAITLTKKGAEQAKEAGRILAEEEGGFIFVSSSYFRTRQTADYMIDSIDSHRILNRFETPLLREQEWNNGLPTAFNQSLEHERGKSSTFYYRFPGGESGADVLNRMVLFCHGFLKEIEEYCRVSGEQNLVVVTHGYAARILLMALLGWTVENFEMVRNLKNCEIVKVALTESGFELKSELNLRPKLQHGFIYNKEDLK